MTILCDGGLKGPTGHADADFTVMSRCMCLSANACYGCVGMLLLGWVQGWQDYSGACARCDAPQPHLEDAVIVTRLRGMSIGEAWKKFTEEKGL